MEEETKAISDVAQIEVLTQPASDIATVTSERPAAVATMTASLVPFIALICERLFFMWIIYEGSNDLWMILTITACVNTIYYASYTKITKKKHKVELYAAFKLSRTPAIPIPLVALLAYCYFYIIITIINSSQPLLDLST